MGRYKKKNNTVIKGLKIYFFFKKSKKKHIRKSHVIMQSNTRFCAKCFSLS